MANVFIDFDIILDSELDRLKEELDLLIAANKYIYVWHKEYTVEWMAAKAKELGIKDYVWGYRTKDSSHYGAVDFIIDQNEKLVNRFSRQGIPGNTIQRIK
jgi:hypothetical protein